MSRVDNLTLIIDMQNQMLSEKDAEISALLFAVCTIAIIALVTLGFIYADNKTLKNQNRD